MQTAVRLSTWMLLIVGLSSPVAYAQDVSLAYQFQHFSAGGEGLNAPLGFNADVSIPITGNLEAFGQFDWSRKSESEEFLGVNVSASANFSAFGGGVRWSGRSNPNLAPFVDALFGAMRASGSVSVAGEELADDSGTKAMVQFGGGVTMPLTSGIAALGQVDYRRVFTEEEGLNSVRILGGIRVLLRGR